MAIPHDRDSSSKITADIPSWLLGKNSHEIVRSSGTHFIAKTLHHFSEVFENEFFCERYAAKQMLLQSIDPRIKITVLFAFMLFSSFSSSIVILFTLAVIAFVYAKLSGLDGKDFLRRAWVYIPLMVFLFSLPGASSLFTKGTPLITLLNPGTFFFRDGLYFTASGIEMALRLALRPGISLSFAFLLLLTTGWSRITGALASMRVPLTAVSILNMAYRYIFIMTATAANMMEARFLRTVGKLKASENRRFISGSAAGLFIKSHYFSEEIYDAMICRGFTGRPVSIGGFRTCGADILFFISNAVILIVLIMGDRLF